MPSEPMTSTRLVEIAQMLHGREHGAVAALAERLGIAYDSLRHMTSGRRPVPPGVTAEVEEMLRAHPPRGVLEISPPPAGISAEMDRDGPCGEALDPALDTLAALAERAGWHPAEIAVAVLGWATHRIADGAGEDAALAALDGAGELLRLRGLAPATAHQKV